MNSANTQNIGQIFNTFFHLIQELEPFVKVNDLEIAFDAKGRVYLQGNDFREPISANFTLGREVRHEMRTVIAKHRSLNSASRLSELA